jgi:single-stranded DNA-binding protein
MVINMDIKEGQLDSEPELHITRRGRPKLTFRLAVSRDGSRAAKHGESGGGGRGADIIHVVMYGERGEAMQPLLRKGARVVVFGWTQSRMYTTPDGTRRMATETVAERIAFQPEMWEDKVSPGMNGTATDIQAMTQSPGSETVPTFSVSSGRHGGDVDAA